MRTNNVKKVYLSVNNLLVIVNKYIWKEGYCLKTFIKLKAILKSTQVLLAPDFNKAFKVAINASDANAGSDLIQEGLKALNRSPE